VSDRPAPKVPPRVSMAERAAEERVRDFREVPEGYSRAQAVKEAERCLQCKKPTCIAGCPVRINIPKFIAEMVAGDFPAAYRTICESNTLPAVCGRVCPQEVQCEVACVLSRKYDPIAIGALERFVGDWAAENVPRSQQQAPARLGAVVVVGAGPAGLTAAADLRRFGYHVVLFEALHEPGGVLTYGIPEFRLPRVILKEELGRLTDTGVEIVPNYVIGRILTVEELLADFGAVFLATGAGLPHFMNVPGEMALGAFSANEFLSRVNLLYAYRFPEFPTPVKVGKRVAVIGAGNTAMDAARCSRRLRGVEEVTIVYRRSRAEMPAREAEIEHAEEEGVQFELLQAPTRVLSDDKGWVTGLEIIKMELGEPDESGRRRPVPISGSEFVMPLDTVIVAVGQAANPLISQTTHGLKTGRDNVVVVDSETLMSSRPRVFAGGDVITGGTTVIEAMGHGRKAAAAIHAYLGAR